MDICTVDTLCLCGAEREAHPSLYISPATSIMHLTRRRDLLGEHDLVLELRRETPVSNSKFFAVLHQLDHLLVEIRAQLLLQTSKLHPEGLSTCADRRVLELSRSCQYRVHK
jgi:hypothetical protein